jgi:hypothetical protein
MFEINGVKTLTDPWYFGTAFEGGWGLRYDNPDALNWAKEANYLWISHFHSDHFHVPTLKKLLEINPEITILGNCSYNFQLDEAIKNIGFRNIIAFPERKTLRIDGDIELTRYPVTGIDNMLHIKYQDVSILNYNDCNLPRMSQRLLKKKIGHLDVFMANFNHAGKLLLYPYPSDEIIRNKLKRAFKNSYEVFSPKFVVPFASHHYYRAEESFHQNISHLINNDLMMLDPKIISWKIGDIATYDPEKSELRVDSSNNKTTLNELDKVTRKKTITYHELSELSKAYVANLRRQFLFTAWFLPKFYIKISDLNISVRLSVKEGIVKVEDNQQPHIIAHSEALSKWWGKKYGTDSFIVGAHFAISSKKKIPLYWQIVFGMLIDNRLDLKSILLMLFSRSGREFLICRREEILGRIISFRLAAEYQKQD